MRSFTRVHAWARYEHEGVGFVHLWSADHPKRVIVVREDEADPRLVPLLRQHVPMLGSLTVLSVLPEGPEEGVLYVHELVVAQLEQGDATNLQLRIMEENEPMDGKVR